MPSACAVVTIAERTFPSREQLKRTVYAIVNDGVRSTIAACSSSQAVRNSHTQPWCRITIGVWKVTMPR